MIAAALAMATGCAHQQQQQQVATHKQEISALQARLQEAERTNGRLMVRIEELEDDVFLLHDRVDANRIALQRKGVMGPRAHAHNRANQGKPGPAPETHWGAQPYRQPDPRSQRPVTRIPLGGQGPSYGPPRQQQQQQQRQQPQAEQVPTNQVPATRGPNVRGPTTTATDDELVITESEFAEFEARYGGSPKKKTGSASGPKNPQPNVTSERLATTEDLGGSGEKIAEKAPRKRKDALGTYKDALATYRAGDYAKALDGFEDFLAGGPRADYMDNALYWIGECHFGLGEYDTAVKYFQRVLSEQPDGNKVPDAMLKMSLAYDRVGRGQEATRLLEDLNRQYPATNAGRLASQKLEERE